MSNDYKIGERNYVWLLSSMNNGKTSVTIDGQEILKTDILRGIFSSLQILEQERLRLELACSIYERETGVDMNSFWCTDCQMHSEHQNYCLGCSKQF